MAWSDRFGRQRDEPTRHFYHPLGAVDITGFVTATQLAPDAVLMQNFVSMPFGVLWGMIRIQAYGDRV